MGRPTLRSSPRSLLLALALTALVPTVLRAQGALIFADGFEAASFWEWSGASPAPAPPEVCTRPITLVDTSGATVVGNGTPGSCTEAAFNAALASNNGMIRFNCGTRPLVITLTAQKVITGNLVIDGGGRVALSGGGTTRILVSRPPFGTTPRPTLTVQRLVFLNGSTFNLSGSGVSNGGAAIFRDQGANLRVIDCLFAGNVGPPVGQDVAGGAIYSLLQGTTTVVGSTFNGNRCSSGGALGNLHNDLVVVNSLLIANAATGNSGNPGNGGNGGGSYMDGVSQTVSICGIRILDNDANALGGGVFRVSNDGVGPMTIDRSTVAGNEIPNVAGSGAGGLYLQGLQLTITDTTIANNVANNVGGLWVVTNPGTQTLAMTNDTVAGNHARTGLGAGLAVADGITGALRHVTIARNSNEGAASFASALAGGSGLDVSNSVIADNAKVFIWENTSCNQSHSGIGSFQWPDHNAGGQSELACASVTFQSPGLGPLQDNGGPTPTILPTVQALNGAADNCPATDQRGQPRPPQDCTPGAVEMP